MPEDSIYVRTLWRALDILGGEHKLARRLRVPAAELREWLSGAEVPPLAYFLMAVDVVEEAARRESEARARPDSGARARPDTGKKKR